jgi:predicted MFS family arabinose efflux permease
VFTAGNLLLQIPIGWIADRMSRRRVLLGCAMVGVAGAALLPLLLKQPLLLWPLLFIWGGTVFAFYPVALSLLGQNVPANQFASANASFIVFYELGSISGPVVGGAAMDILGPQGLPLAVGAVALAFIAIVFWEKRAKPQSAD